jgi:hypothetical protein
MKDENLDRIAMLLSRNQQVHPAFRAAVAGALMTIGEEMAAEKILEDTNEAQR